MLKFFCVQIISLNLNNKDEMLNFEIYILLAIGRKIIVRLLKSENRKRVFFTPQTQSCNNYKNIFSTQKITKFFTLNKCQNLSVSIKYCARV